MSEQDLEKKFSEYQKLAANNPKVDVNALMVSALVEESKKAGKAKARRWPLLASFLFPPAGLVLAVKYYASGEDSDKRTARICIAIAFVSMFLYFVSAKALLYSGGAGLDQLRQLGPQNLNELTQ